MIEELAKAMHDALYNDGESDAWMSGKCPLDSVTIDGDVDLMKAVRAVLERLREPTPKMLEIGGIMGELPEWAAGDTWRAMIDAVLNEGKPHA